MHPHNYHGKSRVVTIPQIQKYEHGEGKGITSKKNNEKIVIFHFYIKSTIKLNVRKESQKVDGGWRRNGRDTKAQLEFKAKCKLVEARRAALRQSNGNVFLENWQHRKAHFAAPELLINILMHNQVTNVT